MKVKYGISYLGSKAKLAKDIIKIFPKADNFYDLFGGGFSITHAIFLKRNRDFKHFYFNEIKSDITQLIKDAIAGKYNYNVFKPKFIGREEFSKRIDEAYIRVLWSFGNIQTGYMYSKEIEPYKKSMHNAIIFNKFDDLAKKVFNHDGFKDGYSIEQKRLFLRARIEYYRLNGIPKFLYPYLSKNQINELTDKYKISQQLMQLMQLMQLQQLERLEQLQRFQQFKQFEQLKFSSKSYDQVEVKDSSIIYCDIPYYNTIDYNTSFNHKEFFNWAYEQKNPVFISEYNISDKRFKLIKIIKRHSMLYSNKDKAIFMDEKIYINKAAQERFL